MFALAFALCALTFNVLVGYYASYKRNVRASDRIYDIGYRVLPDLSAYDWLSDLALVVPAAALAFALPKWPASKRDSMFTLLALMFAFRSLVNIVTTYPSPKKCALKPPFGFCNDFMFSGHTTFNIVAAHYIGGAFWPAWPALGSVLSVATREHYTADVVMAWIVFAALKCRV